MQSGKLLHLSGQHNGLYDRTIIRTTKTPPYCIQVESVKQQQQEIFKGFFQLRFLDDKSLTYKVFNLIEY